MNHLICQIMKLQSLILPLLAILTVSGAQASSGQQHRFGTYNIRYMNKEDNQADNYKSWHNRYTHVTDLILKYDFDVIGLEEVCGYNNNDPQRINKNTGKSQLDDVKDALTDYTIVAWEREGKDYQYKLVAFKTARYELTDQGWIGLSPAGKLGDPGWDPALYPIKRRAGWVRLRDKNSREEFIFCVTHMNYGASLDGIYGNAMLGKKLSELAGDLPVVLVGDFNMRRKDHENAYRGEAAYFDDSRFIAEQNECLPAENGQTELTAVEWHTMAKPSAMKGSEFDYIFSHNVDVKERHILTDYYLSNGEPANPSDHFPILAVCSLRDPRGPQTWHVAPDGNDNADGSASAPFATLVKAIAAASSGDEIRLSAGTYRQSAVIDKSITITGGYDSSFEDISGISVIDGDVNGDDVDGKYTDNLSNLLSVPQYYNLTLRNIELRNCISSSTNDESAVYFAGNTLRIMNTTFCNNRAIQNGGALRADCNEIISENCIFRNNTAPGNGGAIWSNIWGDSRFTRCTFDANEAPVGAAVYATSDSPDPSHTEFTCARNIFDGCAIINNISKRKGAIALDGKMPNIRTILVNSTLTGNIMESPSGMAGMTKKYGGSAINATLVDKGNHECHNSTVEMAHCTIAGNSATFKGSNKANYGGAAIFTSGGTTHLVNNIFLLNTTDAGSGYSDVMAETGASSKHNLFSSNGSTSCPIGTGSLYASDGDAQKLISVIDGKVKLSYKDGYAPAIYPLSSKLGDISLNTISGADRDIERTFGIDLDNDGLSSRTLVSDQWDNMRKSSTMPGAIEYIENSAVENIDADRAPLKVKSLGNSRYLISGIDGGFSICSISGASVFSGHGESTATINLSGSPAGIYIISSGGRAGKIMLH